ncbi:MAG: putative glycosyl transferase [Thermomicrobiales bacterium]|nr:putative glycosyl transferase [Thermomicrobiales bacterium]
MSIGLPVFNGADYVAEAIASILRQTYQDFELLIQDNASTDRTEEICQEFARRDSRVSYVRNPENVGAISNYNLVFERARGRYFKWAAHDDVCAPTFFERCVEVLDAEPSVVLCSGQTRLINDDGSPVSLDRARGCYVTRHGAPAGSDPIEPEAPLLWGDCLPFGGPADLDQAVRAGSLHRDLTEASPPSAHAA